MSFEYSDGQNLASIDRSLRDLTGVIRKNTGLMREEVSLMT